MAALFDDDFESGGLTGYTNTGTPVVDTTAALHGTYGLHIATSAASEFASKSYPASSRMHVGRIYFRIVTLPAVRQGLVVATGSSGMRIYMEANGKIGAQALAGTIQITAGAYNDGAMHYVDWRFDRTDAATAKVDWAVDGVAQTQATAASAAADMSAFRIGVDGTATAEYYLDDLVGTDQSASYPIGAIPATAMLDPIGMSGFFGA